MYIDFINKTKYPLDEFYSHYQKIMQDTMNILHLKGDYLMSVTIVSKIKIHKLNREFRNVDRPTDVISFAFLDDKNEIIKGKGIPIDLGEIYICYDVARENAKKYGNTINREMDFLFCHGLLHLLGYDHMKKEDEEVMFALQDKIIPPKEIK